MDSQTIQCPGRSGVVMNIYREFDHSFSAVAEFTSIEHSRPVRVDDVLLRTGRSRTHGGVGGRLEQYRLLHDF